jgi:hypothetical protein
MERSEVCSKGEEDYMCSGRRSYQSLKKRMLERNEKRLCLKLSQGCVL